MLNPKPEWHLECVEHCTAREAERESARAHESQGALGLFQALPYRSPVSQSVESFTVFVRLNLHVPGMRFADPKP